MVSAKTLGGAMSVFVTTTKTGSFRARAIPRWSLAMPTIPWFAPTRSIAKSGASPVRPKTVVLKYLSWPRDFDFQSIMNVTKEYMHSASICILCLFSVLFSSLPARSKKVTTLEDWEQISGQEGMRTPR